MAQEVKLPQMSCKSCLALFFIQVEQSGASNFAKHGGAYFLAVGGSIKDPLAAMRPKNVTTFFTTSAKLIGSHGVGCRIFKWISSFENRKNLSANKREI